MPKPRNYRNNPYYVPKPPVPTPSPGGALTRFSPPATPIYPSPIPPPRFTPPPPPGLRGFAPKALAVAKAAGSFKAPPGLGAVARRAGGFAGRAFPGIGWAFVAFDALLLACAAGLLPGSICPRPDNPSPGGSDPGFSGGQCNCVLYNVRIHFIFDGDTSPGDQLAAGFTEIQAYGPISGSRLIKLTPFADGTTRTDIEILCRGKAGENCTPSLVWRLGYSFVSNYRSHRIENRGTVDGQVDNCGNPQPQPQPRQLPDIINNFHFHAGNININITLPSALPPSPLPKKAPNIINPPSPYPDININNGSYFNGGGGDDPDFDIDYIVNPAPRGNFNNPPDIFNNFPPAPEPRLRSPDPFPKQNAPAGSAPSSNPPPETPPPLPDRLPPDSTDEDKYIYRQNKETLDKVYKANAEILEIQKEQQRQGKILENIQSLLDVEVQGSQLITRCDDIDIFYSYKAKVLTAINQQLNQVKAIEQTIINEVCAVEAASVVAAPDWWQVRLRGDIPQLALIFRVVTTRTYHKLTVPHPISEVKLASAPIKSYRKGNWQGELVLIDNSKFLCNCETREEAGRLLAIVATLIDPVFLGSPIRAYYAERKGHEVGIGNMRATSAMYFPLGQQQTMPAWRVTFTKDGQ